MSAVNLTPIEPFSRRGVELRPAQSWLSLNVLLQVLGATLGLGGQHLINQHNAFGFVLWMGSNAVLMVLQFRMRLGVLVALHIVYFGLCMQGLMNWSR